MASTVSNSFRRRRRGRGGQVFRRAVPGCRLLHHRRHQPRQCGALPGAAQRRLRRRELGGERSAAQGEGLGGNRGQCPLRRASTLKSGTVPKIGTVPIRGSSAAGEAFDAVLGVEMDVEPLRAESIVTMSPGRIQRSRARAAAALGPGAELRRAGAADQRRQPLGAAGPGGRAIRRDRRAADQGGKRAAPSSSTPPPARSGSITSLPLRTAKASRPSTRSSASRPNSSNRQPSRIASPSRRPAASSSSSSAWRPAAARHCSRAPGS